MAIDAIVSDIGFFGYDSFSQPAQNSTKYDSTDGSDELSGFMHDSFTGTGLIPSYFSTTDIYDVNGDGYLDNYEQLLMPSSSPSAEHRPEYSHPISAGFSQSISEMVSTDDFPKEKDAEEASPVPPVTQFDTDSNPALVDVLSSYFQAVNPMLVSDTYAAGNARSQGNKSLVAPVIDEKA